MPKLAPPQPRTWVMRPVLQGTGSHSKASAAAQLEPRLRIATAVAMFAGLILSRHLWLSERAYPLTPVFPFVGVIPSPLDYLLYGGLLVALVVIAFAGRPAKWTGLAVALALVL